MSDVISLWVLVALCGAGTYLWRGLGVMFSDRVRLESGIFTWAGCVAYAMVAGLIIRILLLPSGSLAETALTHRLLASALALAIYFAARRNLFVGVVTGFIALVILSYERLGGF